MSWEMTQQGALLCVRLTNGSLNTLTPTIMDEVASAVDAAAKDQSIRAIRMISAAEAVYCYGIDPQVLLNASVDARLEVFRSLGRFVRIMLGCGLPVLSAINGPAFAGGAVLALLADYSVIHSKDGKICFSEAKVGLPLPLFVQDLIRLKCRPGDFFEVAVMARNVDAQSACEIGFCRDTYTDISEANIKLQSVEEKISRLSRRVIQETMLAGRSELLAGLTRFIDDPKHFREYMSDEFIGKGLRSLMKS